MHAHGCMDAHGCACKPPYWCTAALVTLQSCQSYIHAHIVWKDSESEVADAPRMQVTRKQRQTLVAWGSDMLKRAATIAVHLTTLFSGGAKCDPLCMFNDCAGSDTPYHALCALGAPAKVIAISEKAAAPRRFLNASAHIQQHGTIVCTDLLKRDHKDHRLMCRETIYTAGFPCKPFSGLNNGFQCDAARMDDANAKPLYGVGATIQARRPPLVILENVTRVMRCWDAIRPILNPQDAYFVTVQHIDPKHLGVPAQRRRVYGASKLFAFELKRQPP